MRRSSLTALVIGIASVWLTQWATLEGAGRLATWLHGSPLWYEAIFNISFAIALVFPGFVTGWISAHRGIFLGALTGLIGAITYGTFALLLKSHIGFWHYVSSGIVFVGIATSAFGLTVTCAAGGAAGETLRSNNRWRGP